MTTVGDVADSRVPGYLGRVLDSDGAPTGTCFCVAPGVLVTACHVVDYIGAAVKGAGAQVRVDPLAGGESFVASLARMDPLRDLAVLTCDARSLPVAGPLTATDQMPLRSKVTVTGHAVPDDREHTYRFLDSPGEWAGGATRDDAVLLGRMTSSAVVPGMSGAPVILDSDGAIAGVVSGRYNSTDGWLAGTVWIARTEDLAPLLAGIANVPMRPTPLLGDQQARDRREPTHSGSRERLEKELAEDLVALSPRLTADRVRHLPVHRAAAVLARVPVSDAAELMEYLLTEGEEGLVVALLAAMIPSAAQRLVDQLAPRRGWLQHFPAARARIEACERSSRKVLGESTGPLARTRSPGHGTQGFYQSFKNGLIHWCNPAGALVTYGAIAEAYAAADGSGGRLGFPLTPDVQAGTSPQKTEGSLQRFEGETDFAPDVCERIGRCGASIYWSGTYGPHMTWGPIAEFFERQEGTQGDLGFPVTDPFQVGPSERAGGGTTGWCQRFEGGVVYSSERTKTVAMSPDIAAYHDSCGGVNSPRGFPVSPELPAAKSPYGTTGRCQRFEGREDYEDDILEMWSDVEGPGNATVYASDAYGIYTVGFGNGVLYERMGSTTSWLGFPVTDEIDPRTSKGQTYRTIQEFEGGAIFFRVNYGSITVAKPVMEYVSQRDLLARLGFPMGKEKDFGPAAEGEIQFFEHGLVTVHNSQVEAWMRLEGND